MQWPEISDDPMYQLLRNEDIKSFNEKKSEADISNLHGKNYRGLDLRGLNADGLDLHDAYFRNADLRGIDFRNCDLEGASFAEAKISGCYFPKTISAIEIRNAVEFGTRIRTGD